MKKSAMMLGCGAALFAANVFWACAPQEKQSAMAYTVEGVAGPEVKDGEIVMMQIVNIETGQPDTMFVDTVRQGAFSFAGVTDTAALVCFRSETRRTAMGYLEGGKLRVELMDGVVTGTPLNDEQATFERAVMALPDTLENRDSIEIAMGMDFYHKHAHDLLGYNIFRSYAYVLEYEQLVAEMDSAADIIRNCERFKKIVAGKLKAKQTGPGTMFMDFKGIDSATNDSVSLSKYVGQGKLTLVDFWASWCGPCRREIPNIAACYEKYGKNLNVVGVAVWEQRIEDHLRAVKQLKTTWPMIYEDQRSVTDMYGILGIPHIILFAPDGTILARGLHGEGIAQAIEEALAKK